jgi:hypothetical protein
MTTVRDVFVNISSIRNFVFSATLGWGIEYIRLRVLLLAVYSNNFTKDIHLSQYGVDRGPLALKGIRVVVDVISVPTTLLGSVR